MLGCPQPLLVWYGSVELEIVGNVPGALTTSFLVHPCFRTELFMG